MFKEANILKSKRQMEVISITSCRINAIYTQWAKNHGISYNTLMVMTAIYEIGPCAQRDICEGWLIPKQTVNTVVKDLEKKGFLSREQGRDKKEKLISFTSEGKKFAESFLNDTADLENKVCDILGEDSTFELAKSMVIFANTLQGEAEKNGK